MITLRRAEERQHERRHRQEGWLTFYPQDRADPLAGGFGTLELLKEGRFPPRAAIRQPLQEAEIITYVREGALAYEDSERQSGLIRAGEFQRMTAGRGIRYSETNASPSEWAHVFQIWLRRQTEELEPGHEQRRFTVAERRGILCVVASPDGRNSSLRVHQNALLHSSILERGQHIFHELSSGRGVWLHIVQGEVTLGEVTLRTGDGAGITTERAVSFTANEATELLLLDVGELTLDVASD